MQDTFKKVIEAARNARDVLESSSDPADRKVCAKLDVFLRGSWKPGFTFLGPTSGEDDTCEIRDCHDNIIKMAMADVRPERQVTNIRTVTAYSFQDQIFKTLVEAELASAKVALRNLESLKNKSWSPDRGELQSYEEYRRHAHTLLKNLDSILSEITPK